MNARRLILSTLTSAAVLAAALLVSTFPVQAQSTVKLAAGTKIAFTINDNLHTDFSKRGDKFTGVVSRDVRVGNRIVIPQGSVVHGRVAHVKRAGRFRGKAEMDLRFDTIELPDGAEFGVSATLTTLDPSEKETVAYEGTIEGEGSKKRDAATIGVGAGAGAAIGAAAGGGDAAAKGAAIGAAAGLAAVFLTRGKDIEIKRGSEIAIMLDRPLTIPVK